MRKVFVFIYSVVLVCSSYSANGSEAKKSSQDVDFFATVNGTPLTKGLLDLNIKAAVSQGQKDSSDLQNALKNELINRELLAQEATRLGLDRDIDFRDHFTQLKQTLLIQALLEEHFKKNPLTEARLREEYDRQRKLLGDGPNLSQYRVSQIIVANETDALDLIRRIQKGELFGKLAQQFSIDEASKGNGGQIGWVLPNQLIPPIANVLASLNKGAISTAPIRTQNGWVIVRLDDRRPFKLPSFEESVPQLRQALTQQYLSDMVRRLRESAKVIQ